MEIWDPSKDTRRKLFLYLNTYLCAGSATQPGWNSPGRIRSFLLLINACPRFFRVFSVGCVFCVSPGDRRTRVLVRRMASVGILVITRGMYATLNWFYVKIAVKGTTSWSSWSSCELMNFNRWSTEYEFLLWFTLLNLLLSIVSWSLFFFFFFFTNYFTLTFLSPALYLLFHILYCRINLYYIII